MKAVFVDVDGVNTRYLCAGDPAKDPLLLIHGLTLTADIWLRNMDALAEEFFVVAPDMIGSGFTDAPANEDQPILQQKIDHLYKFADLLGLRSFCACGSSYGALVATLMYVQAPDRVNRLIINGSGSCFNSVDEVHTNMSGAYERITREMAEPSLETWRQSLARSFYNPSTVPEELLLPLLTCYARPAAIAAWKRSIAELIDKEVFRKFAILPRLHEIRVEALLTWGRQDPGAPYENAVNALTRLPRARLVTFDCCGHMPMLEHPRAYNRAVRDFLSRQ